MTLFQKIYTCWGTGGKLQHMSLMGGAIEAITLSFAVLHLFFRELLQATHYWPVEIWRNFFQHSCFVSIFWLLIAFQLEDILCNYWGDISVISLTFLQHSIGSFLVPNKSCLPSVWEIAMCLSVISCPVLPSVFAHLRGCCLPLD